MALYLVLRMELLALPFGYSYCNNMRVPSVPPPKTPVGAVPQISSLAWLRNINFKFSTLGMLRLLPSDFIGLKAKKYRPSYPSSLFPLLGRSMCADERTPEHVRSLVLLCCCLPGISYNAAVGAYCLPGICKLGSPASNPPTILAACIASICCAYFVSVRTHVT